MTIKVAYLGPANTFTEKVTRELFPNEELIPLQPIRKVVLAVESGKTDRAVVPLENFYDGEVRDTLDCLTDCSETKIIAEKALTVVHCIGALPGHGKITQILSKDTALGQCSKYLCEKFPEAQTIATKSTAEAACHIAKNKIYDAAAIAPEQALLESGLEIMAKDICPKNSTRFAVLGKKPTESTGYDKTFVAIHPPIKDQPGVLLNVIRIIGNMGINLEYIQSRPDGKSGYFFYLELDGHRTDRNVKTALEEIELSLDPKKEHSETIKVLGSYQNTDWKTK